MILRSIALFFILLSSSLWGVEKRIGLIVKSNFRGEISFANRIQIACKNIDWEADLIWIEDPKELVEKKYDFVISFVPGNYERPKCPNYLAIFDPVHHFFNKKGHLSGKYRSYDGYLLTYSPTLFEKQREICKGYRPPYLRWYPTVQKREYQMVNPSHLFYICCAWGNRFEGEQFQKCLTLLDKEPYMRFYGGSSFYSHYPQSYQHPIPYDGENLFQIASQEGVSLVLHSSDHNTFGLPSGRIFEAAAASTVIICDQNQFVREHFGNSVLFIDTNLEGFEIYRQIQDHMKWIQENKEEALEMAKRAHEIYLENFALEDQLLKLGKFHDRIRNQKRQLDSYAF